MVKAGAPTFGEVYHICAAERCTLPELLELMALHSPRCAPAAAAGRCIVLGAAQAAQLSAEEKALLGSFNPFDGADRQASTEKAEAELDWRATPAAEWLADTVRWLDSAENTAARPGPAPYDDAALMAKCAALAATAELAPRARTAEKL